jgi:hypothetical protein
MPMYSIQYASNTTLSSISIIIALKCVNVNALELVIGVFMISHPGAVSVRDLNHINHRKCAFFRSLKASRLNRVFQVAAERYYGQTLTDGYLQ